MRIDFLELEDVLLIHRDQIARYGGDPAVRDLGLLQSAIAQPRVSFEGRYLHRDLIEMAAAYLYHVVGNHPFVDGNKQTGSVAAIVFHDLNGVELRVGNDRFADFVFSVAKGDMDKAEVARFLRRHTVRGRPRRKHR